MQLLSMLSRNCPRQNVARTTHKPRLHEGSNPVLSPVQYVHPPIQIVTRIDSTHILLVDWNSLRYRGLRESCKINFESHTHAQSINFDVTLIFELAAAILNLVSMLLIECKERFFLQDSLKVLYQKRVEPGLELSCKHSYKIITNLALLTALTQPIMYATLDQRSYP